VALALIRFSERFGTKAEDGSICMPAFTHQEISQYVGTTREVVTHYMVEFRRRGFIKYSRREVTLYGSLRELARQE
jgi:CRP-like cAMP-binding protein